MSTVLFTHPVCLEHDNGPGHPESPARLAAILTELSKPDYITLDRREAPKATVAQLARVHDPAYIERLLALIPVEGRVELDHETSLVPASGEAALRAAGAVIAAVDARMRYGSASQCFLCRATAGSSCRRATGQRVLPVQ